MVTAQKKFPISSLGIRTHDVVVALVADKSELVYRKLSSYTPPPPQPPSPIVGPLKP